MCQFLRPVLCSLATRVTSTKGRGVDCSNNMDMAIAQYRKNQRQLQLSDRLCQQRVRQATQDFQQASQQLENSEVRNPASGYAALRAVQAGVNVYAGQVQMIVVPVEQM